MKKKLFTLLTIFIISILCVYSLMVILMGLITEKGCGEIFFPTNLDKLKVLIKNIQDCYDNNKLLIHAFHAINFVFLQVWCIPGTVLFNLFGGAVFGVLKGTLVCLSVRLFYKIS